MRKDCSVNATQRSTSIPNKSDASLRLDGSHTDHQHAGHLISTKAEREQQE
jgi:hypothetical protein